VTSIAHAVAVADVPSLVAGAHGEVPLFEQIRPGKPAWSRRVANCLKEGLLLVGAVYALPVAILAIGTLMALTINGLLLAAGWAWSAAL